VTAPLPDCGGYVGEGEEERLQRERAERGALLSSERPFVEVGGDMFSSTEINKKVEEHIAKAEAEDASVLILAQAEIRDGQAGASLYAYQRLGEHFGAGEFVHWSPGVPVDAGVEFKLKW